MLCCCGGVVIDAITRPWKEASVRQQKAEQLPCFCRETEREPMMMMTTMMMSVSSAYGTQLMKCHSCREAHLNLMALVPKWKKAGKRNNKDGTFLRTRRQLAISKALCTHTRQQRLFGNTLYIVGEERNS